MSTDGGTPAEGVRDNSRLFAATPRAAVVESWRGFRLPALAAVGLLTLTYLSVLYHVTDIVGGSTVLVVEIAATLVLATVLGRTLSERTAFLVAVGLIVGGLTVYFFSVPESNRALFTVGRVVSDTIALLTGLSVLRLTEAGIWALAVAPAPAFLSWYLAIRRRYVGAVVVGCGALAFFVLTGDADVPTTLAGVVGAAGAVGLGTFDLRGGFTEQLDTLAVVISAMVVLSVVLSVVPGGAAQPLLPNRGAPTIEQNLVSSTDQVRIQGTTRLSPKVRFVVESNSPERWQTASFDRYTGGGWVRTGEETPYRYVLESPPGASRTLTQRVTAKGPMGVVPAAWKPVAVSGDIADNAEVTQQGNFVLRSSVSAEESFTVRSRIPRYTREQLRRAGDDYPDHVESAYLQLPDSTPGRVGDRAEQIAGDADNAYDKAVAIEQFLERTKRYSLTVEKPDGDVADKFLFEMDAGYCVYYATTMVVMLRSQGVPARFVTGYTSGERVAEDTWVVRGLDSHAWVEVYFPEVGWVPFDPTPGGPRQSVESARLAEANRNNESDIHAAGSEGPNWTPTPDQERDTDPANEAPIRNETFAVERLREGVIEENVTGGQTPAGLATGQTGDSGGIELPELPSRETLGFGAVLVFGLFAGARRLGVTGQVYALAWLHYQGSGNTPTEDAERAFARLEYLLGREYRPRETGETPRAYLETLSRRGLDERALRVAHVYERARYGRGVTQAEANEAVATVDSLVQDAGPSWATVAWRVLPNRGRAGS